MSLHRRAFVAGSLALGGVSLAASASASVPFHEEGSAWVEPSRVKDISAEQYPRFIREQASRLDMYLSVVVHSPRREIVDSLSKALLTDSYARSLVNRAFSTQSRKFNLAAGNQKQIPGVPRIDRSYGTAYRALINTCRSGRFFAMRELIYASGGTLPQGAPKLPMESFTLNFLTSVEHHSLGTDNVDGVGGWYYGSTNKEEAQANFVGRFMSLLSRIQDDSTLVYLVSSESMSDSANRRMVYWGQGLRHLG